MPDEQNLTTPHSDNFRRTLGRLPTGVVVVTGGDPENPSGLVCGSFMSLSLDPPLVGVSPTKTSTSWPAISDGGYFCANVLSDDQEELARKFSASGTDKFAGVEWTPAPSTGAPLLAGAVAWIDCRIQQRIETGDHWLVVGEVLELSVEHDADSLIFHGGAFRTLLGLDGRAK